MKPEKKQTELEIKPDHTCPRKTKVRHNTGCHNPPCDVCIQQGAASPVLDEQQGI